MLAFLAAILPGLVLPTLKAWIENRSNAETTKRETALAIINERREASQQRGATVRTGMGHKPFWVAWSLFAWPLGVWWLAVMIDTMFLLPGSVPDLPNSIRPWADTIFENIFLPGAIAASATVIGTAIARR